VLPLPRCANAMRGEKFLHARGHGPTIALK
jgi:hypothetical protein